MMTPHDYVFGSVPMKHQRDVFLASADREYHAFFHEPGLGKTKSLIDNIAYLYEAGKIKGAVIATVKGVVPTMELVEFPKHMPAGIKYKVFRYSSAAVSTKAFADAFAKFMAFNGLKVFVYNTEAVISDKLLELLRAFYKAVGKKNILFGQDESSMVKTPTAKRTKTTIKIARESGYRRILTGTPITQGPLDVFSQASVLGDPKKLLGHSSFTSFRNYFAVVEKKTFGNRSFDVVTGFRNTQELSALMRSFASIIKKEDALDLPEKIYSTVIVEMTPEQQRVYNKLQEEAILELEAMGEQVEITNILTLLLKLHQVVCGQLKYVDYNGHEVYSTVPNNRLPTMMDLIDNEEGKIVIWANYRQTIRDIVAELSAKYGPESVIQFHGGVKAAEREVAAKRFQDLRDPARFFVANQQSGGMGLTLTASNLAIYYSNDYSLERRIQSEDRIHRISQTKSARYIDLVTPGTVDVKILTALQKRKKFADSTVISNWREVFE